MTTNKTVEVEARTQGLSLQGVTIKYGAGPKAKTAIKNMSMDISSGEFVCLLGASGSGKSTVLNSLAGFIRPSEGRILLNGTPVVGPGADRGVVFQHHSLFPWKTAVKNVEFGLKMKGVGKDQRSKRAHELLDMVGLVDDAERYPKELSGGMCQRVAIARTLAPKPEVLLMDEPFGALDAQTRSRLQVWLTEIWQELGTTVVFVTHDIDEALFLGDKVVVLGGQPSTILKSYRVEFDRPRTLEFSAQPEVVSIKRDVLGLLSNGDPSTVN